MKLEQRIWETNIHQDLSDTVYNFTLDNIRIPQYLKLVMEWLRSLFQVNSNNFG